MKTIKELVAQLTDNYNDNDECLIEALAKQQLLADLDAYVNFVEEEEWELAEDASLNAYEILQSFRDEDLTNWKKNNYDLIQDILKEVE